MASHLNFDSIPVIDYSLSLDPSTKPALIKDLRHALINVGFLYLSNTPVDQAVVERLISDLPRFFALPQEEKERISMVNSPHFLGYTSLGKERTRGRADIREQIDIATPHETRWTPGAPEYLRLWGPSQARCQNCLTCSVTDTCYSGRRSLYYQGSEITTRNICPRSRRWPPTSFASLLKH